MSHTYRLFAVVLAALVLQACSMEESITPATSTVQFKFELNEKQLAALPSGSSVVLTVTTPSGLPLLSNHAVGIQVAEDGLVTEPITIAASSYLLTEFMVVHDDHALYAVPKAGSQLAKDVHSPLSHALLASDRAVIPLQLLETRNASAERFGYKTLSLKKPGEWKIMVFTRENGQLTASPAWSYLIAPGISYGGQLEAGMNTLPFNGDPAQTYNLVVEKAGYVKHSSSFVYEEIPGNGNKPFKIILDRIPDDNTFTITPPMAGEFTFRLAVRGSGSLVIDWGDGTTETLTFSPDGMSGESYLEPRHEYATPGPHASDKISITGDLDQIFLLETISVYATDIDLRNLSALETTTLYGLPINGLLDLSQNSALQSLRLEGTYAWEIRMPDSHEIKDFHLDDLDGIISADVVDDVIENIQTNAVENNIMSGTITIIRRAPLSPESLARIQILVDDYGWQYNGGE